ESAVGPVIRRSLAVPLPPGRGLAATPERRCQCRCWRGRRSGGGGGAKGNLVQRSSLCPIAALDHSLVIVSSRFSINPAIAVYPASSLMSRVSSPGASPALTSCRAALVFLPYLARWS